MPTNQSVFHKVEPVYRSLPGWQEDIGSARRLEDLPTQARAFLDLISELAEVPVVLVSVGPRREETIRLT